MYFFLKKKKNAVSSKKDFKISKIYLHALLWTWKHVRFQKTQGVLYIDGFYFDYTIWTLRCILNKIFTLHIKTKEGSLLTHLWGTEALILSNLLLMFDRVAFMEEAISVLKSFSMPLVSLFNEFTFDSHSPISLCVT